MDPTERFAELVADASFAVDEAALVIAAHGDPDCAVDAGLAALDVLAAGVAEPTLEALGAHLFGELGFVGDGVDYYDPRNSYLHDVLARRRGIPITLSIVLVEVGRRAGVVLEGVSTPTHFMARTTARPHIYVDAFAGGPLLDDGALAERFAELAPGVDIDPFLRPATPLEIVARMLGNLVGVHRRRNDRHGLLWSTRLRTLLPGAPADDRRAYAGALAACGDFVQAAKVLEALAEEAVEPESELDAARRLRARLN